MKRHVLQIIIITSTATEINLVQRIFSIMDPRKILYCSREQTLHIARNDMGLEKCKDNRKQIIIWRAKILPKLTQTRIQRPFVHTYPATYA